MTERGISTTQPGRNYQLFRSLAEKKLRKAFQMIFYIFVGCHAFNLLEDKLLANDELNKIQKYVREQKDRFLLTEEQIESQSNFITKLNADYPELRKYTDFHDGLLTDRSYYEQWLRPNKRFKINANSVRIVSRDATDHNSGKLWQSINNDTADLPESSALKLSLALALTVFTNQTHESCPENGRRLSPSDISNGVVDCLVTVRV